jgi:hypothetical protein
MATPALLRNDGGSGNHWVGLSLVGKFGDVSSFGARVTLSGPGGRQVKIHQPGNAYLTYHDPRMHFGLGKSDRIEKIEILWPDGYNEVFLNVPADQYHVLSQGRGKPL